MSLITELVRKLHDLNGRDLERLARELERIRVLASKDIPTEPVNVYPSGNPKYVSLGGETNNIDLWSGADLIVYSDTGTTEKARIDGATGNITTAGTVDGVDVAGANAAQYVALAVNANIANERVLTGTSNRITITDNGAGSTVVLSTPQNIHTGATPSFTGITLTAAANISLTNTVAAGESLIDCHIIQSDDVAMTGTLRGAYITASSGDEATTGTIRGIEVKARAGYPGETGANVNVLEGFSVSSDAKTYDVTTHRGAEIILDGGAGTSTLAVGLRIANNFQADRATTSYGLQIYRDSFDYTADIQLSSGGLIGGSGGDLFITDAGNVGIGTAAPDAPLHILMSGTVMDVGAATGLAVQRTAEDQGVVVSIIGHSTGSSQINFGHEADEDIGYIKYNHNLDRMAFIVETAEMMAIDSAGRVTVGVGEQGIHISKQVPDVSNASGRIFFNEDEITSLYGFSVMYAGSANPTLGGTAFTLTANKFYIIRHQNSATGTVALSIDRATGNVGIGIATALAKTHIDQSSTTAAIPVLALDQADISEGFINHVGTSAASAAGPISSWTAGNTIQGFVRTEINGVQYWIPYYDAPTS